jgi:hypothetical protein
MAWPPGPLPTNITNATPQQTTHPDLHDQTSQAVNDIVSTVSGMIPGIVSMFATVDALKASGLPEGSLAYARSPVGYGIAARQGGAWAADRVFGSSSATDANGIFIVTAAVAGFATIVHADLLTAKGFPGAGAVTNTSWSRISSNNIETMVTDMPAGTAAANRSVSYTARVRGIL